MLLGSRPTNGGLSLTVQERDASGSSCITSPRASAGRGKGGEVLAVDLPPRILIGIDKEGVVVIQARKSCRIPALYPKPMVGGKAPLRTRSNS